MTDASRSLVEALEAMSGPRGAPLSGHVSRTVKGKLALTVWWGGEGRLRAEIDCPAPRGAVAQLIAEECGAVREMLLAKNRAYGNSALEPLRVFSRASTEEQIRVRLDDKLSRLARGSGEETEDVEADIIGYLVLLRVHRRLAAPALAAAASSPSSAGGAT